MNYRYMWYKLLEWASNYYLRDVFDNMVKLLTEQINKIGDDKIVVKYLFSYFVFSNPFFNFAKNIR